MTVSPIARNDNTITLSIKEANGNKTTTVNITVKQKFTVNFNANGGTVNTASKEVTYSENYGDLPTPTRTGHTFGGWTNSIVTLDNFHSEQEISNGNQINSQGYIYDSTPEVDYRGWNYNNSDWKTSLSAGTYTLSLEFLTPIMESTYSACIAYSDDNSWLFEYSSEIRNVNEFQYTFTLSNTTNIGIMIKCYDGVYRLKIEKDTIHMPFYITNSTKVMYESNHTLTAYWIPNKYTITFDYNGQKNYFTTTNSITQTNYSGINNYTIAGPQSDLTGLTASDVVKLSFDYTYNNLTAQSGNRMIFQIYGTTNFWNVAYRQ